ncbi:MAG: vitamin B12/siderophore transporter, ATP-binding protein FepC/BtuD-like protein [Bacteroidetes bacterium]|nr:vitamin B12/siderophore transporter, ATP-binding protein FepC/BtuD-like protein [Bacteroidota bacterium]
MTKSSCIEIINGTFGFKKNNNQIEVLKKIYLECEPGDYIGVVGVNGSGKSTLLRSICGLLPVLSGTVNISSRSLEDLSNLELSKKISIVLTEKIQGFNLTAFDAVSAGQFPHTNLFNKLMPQQLKIIEEAINACGLKLHRHKLLSELSDGLFQKTMIAKSIAQQTPLMLLDEPTAFLDYASKHELFLLLKNVCAEQNKCVIVSSHDLDLILKYCNKVLMVKDASTTLIPSELATRHEIFKELSGGYL